jgi:ureidoglycolate dehydrogenase (NAD+)
MNRPPEQFRRLAAEQLRAFAAACLRQAGLVQAHAEQLAQLLTNSDLRGVRSHGTRALYGYCRTLRDRGVNPDPHIQVLRETEAAVYIDGDGGLGYAPLMLATEKAIQKAKARGLAAGAACHIGHYGAAGHYVRRALQEDCLAASVQGAYPQYYRSNQDKRAAQYGNPPLCLGLPGQDGPPVILDGATCILADYQRGESFEALEELIPAAFFKSMGYTAVATLLGGALVGQGNERARALEKKWPQARMGGLILVIDLGLFAPADEVRRGVDELVRLAGKEMIPLRGYDQVTLPGTIEYRKEQEYASQGVPVGLEDVERLEKCGAEFGVRPPWLG